MSSAYEGFDLLSSIRLVELAIRFQALARIHPRRIGVLAGAAAAVADLAITPLPWRQPQDQ
jgi:hypothetical protein